MLLCIVHSIAIIILAVEPYPWLCKGALCSISTWSSTFN